jgi:ribosome recycling factor
MENEKMEEMLLELSDRMDKTVSVLKEDFAAIRAGRANPHILDKITIDYYGQQTPLNQVGNISVADARCLVVSPWDSSLLKEIDKAILAANIGLTPTNDGKVIRLVFPALTEDRRRDLTKQIEKMGEDVKVALRNVRREANDMCKAMKKKSEMTEDEQKSSEKAVQDLTDKYIKDLDKITEAKVKEIMTI